MYNNKKVFKNKLALQIFLAIVHNVDFFFLEKTTFIRSLLKYNI